VSRRQGSVTSKCSKGHRKAERRCSSRCLRWYFVTEGPKGPDGRRRRQWSRGYATKREAEVALREEQGRRDRGLVLEPGKMTVGELADRFLEQVRTSRQPRTHESYERALSYVRPRLGQMAVRDLGPSHLLDLYGHLASSGRRDGKPGGLHPRTVRHVHRVVFTMLQRAVKWRILPANPAAGLTEDLVALPDQETAFLDQAQARALLDAAEQAQPWLRTFVLLSLGLGLRRGEALGLQWSAVDLEAGTLTVRRQLQLVRGRLTFKEAPKGKGGSRAGVRTLTLPPFVAAELRRLHADQARLRLAHGASYHAELDLVVCMADGHAVRPDWASKATKMLAQRAGLPEAVHAHTLRHSAASFLGAAGVPPSDIAAQLGHKDGDVLALKVYVHPHQEASERAAAHLERALGAGSVETR
jgi:integrase